MLGLAGPGHERARDIAYANVITTVYSRTTTGMVPNYRNGQGGATCTYDRTEPMVGSWSLQRRRERGWLREGGKAGVKRGKRGRATHLTHLCPPLSVLPAEVADERLCILGGGGWCWAVCKPVVCSCGV